MENSRLLKVQHTDSSLDPTLTGLGRVVWLASAWDGIQKFMQVTQIIAYVAIVFEGCGEAHLLLMQCSIGCYTCNMQTNVRYLQR